MRVDCWRKVLNPHAVLLPLPEREGTRYRVVITCTIVLLLVSQYSIAHAQTTQPASPGPQVANDAALDARIQNGLEFLARQQNAEGFFPSTGPRVALTGLSVMAFLAAGHAPDVGPHGFTVRRAVDWLVQQVPADGYIGAIDGSRMYGHGIVTLALAEAYGVETDAERRVRLREVLSRSLRVILEAQRVNKDPVHAGGWRYEMNSPDSDLSLSGWNALVLRACRNVGLEVPDEAVGGATAYVLSCFRADQAGFSYQPAMDISPAMTGVGVLCLQLLLPRSEIEPTTRPESQAGAASLAKSPINEATQYSYYAHYYVTQASFQIGGETWDAVWKNATGRLSAIQMPDGGWPPSAMPEEPDRVYSTAMSLLTLTVPYQLLPIYQR